MWAPVTGYASQAFGATQLENLEDGILTGNDDRLFFRNTLDMLTGKKQEGGNVVTTLNGAAQKAAYDGLKKQGGKGAVVALEPSTGKILALASFPSYDPSSFAGNSTTDGHRGLAEAPEEEQPRRPDAQPGAARDLPAGLHLQGASPRPRPWRTGCTRRRTRRRRRRCRGPCRAPRPS